jgi:hypothetical protein
MAVDRVIIGGGIFGLYAAYVLGAAGFSVVLLEKEKLSLNRASRVNQARLHTGLHYPRSLLTARDSLGYYQRFREEFPESVRDFKQIYAISDYNSQTSPKAFREFISRLGLEVQNVDPEEYFKAGSGISTAFEVEEPTFDFHALRKDIERRLATIPEVSVFLDCEVEEISRNGTSFELRTKPGVKISARGVVIATYAATNSLRAMLNLIPLNIQFELAEVLIGEIDPSLSDTGFTVMDGPFWSMMPYGNSGMVSLTSVGLTPRQKSSNVPRFRCQDLRLDCTPKSLSNCNECSYFPPEIDLHIQQQMKNHLKNGESFSVHRRERTVKAILSNSEVDDARPTLIQKEPNENIWTIFSGKVSTIFDLEMGLF